MRIENGGVDGDVVFKTAGELLRRQSLKFVLIVCYEHMVPLPVTNVPVLVSSPSALEARKVTSEVRRK
jgi:hypothetical protein